MNEAPRKPFEPEVPVLTARLLPSSSVMLGSLVTIFPVVASFSALPPFGLIMLLGWRLLRPDAFPIWAPVLLGLFDDLLSGQPLGNAMLLWTLCFFAIDLVDTRMMWRDFWQDWLIAAGAIGFCLIAGRIIASPIAAHVDTMLLLQIMISTMFYPLVARLCAWLERKRGRA